MSEPRAERYDTTGATSYDAATAAEPRVVADDAGTGDLTTGGVDVDERLDDSVEENLHHDHLQHDHRLVDPEEHVHELPTMGVDVDAALDRAVDENL